MANHLRDAHKLTPAAPNDAQPKLSFKSDKKFPLPKARKEAIDNALGRFIAKSLVPISIVDNKAFREFVRELNDQYDVPCSKTLTSRLRAEFSKLQKEIKEELQVLEFVGITHDSWTSIATDSYETVTVHYVIEEPVTGRWVLKSRVLDTLRIEGSHTAEAISEFLNTVKKNWGLREIIATTDNAAVEVKSFSLLGWPRVGCFGHLLNLVVRAMLQERRPRDIVAKGRNLVSYMKRSPQATDYFEQKQKLVLEKPLWHSLINDVVTRWNSTVEMLQRLTEQMPALQALVNDTKLGGKVPKIRPHMYGFEEQLIVEQLIKILMPLKKASELLSAESTVTLSYVLVVLDTLKSTLAPAPDIDESDLTHEEKNCKQVIEKLKKQVTDGINARFQHTELYELATMLDPATKSWACLKYGMPYVKEKLVDHLMRLDVESGKVKEEPDTTATATPPENEGAPSLPALPEDAAVKVEPVSPPTKKVKREEENTCMLARFHSFH